MFITVILVVGLIGGLATLRAAIVTELSQLGEAILQLDPGYNVAETLTPSEG